jgi:hypothetical protein
MSADFACISQLPQGPQFLMSMNCGAAAARAPRKLDTDAAGPQRGPKTIAPGKPRSGAARGWERVNSEPWKGGRTDDPDFLLPPHPGLVGIASLSGGGSRQSRDCPRLVSARPSRALRHRCSARQVSDINERPRSRRRSSALKLILARFPPLPNLQFLTQCLNCGNRHLEAVRLTKPAGRSRRFGCSRTRGCRIPTIRGHSRNA